ncbi:MAG: DUF1499 domain-containing protein [Hyphomicrobium sp.]
MKQGAFKSPAITRTIYAPDQPPSFLARWASRLALFFAAVLPVTFFLHRLFGLPTPVALNLAAACFAGAALVLVMGLIAGLDIWVTGRQGAARIVVATTVAAALLAIPLGLFIVSRNWPVLNDVTTDVKDPPSLGAAEKARAPGSNPVTYPAARFASLQQASYPDIKTLVIPRSSEETFELVLQAIGKLKMRSTYEAPPGEEPGAPGVVEIADQTLVFGFIDDVAIRIAGDEATSRIDVRSSSRYGKSDFGRNAERVRIILKEISGRLEASVPNADAALRAQRKKDAKAAVKQLREGGPESTAKRSKRDPSRSSTRRAPVRKASPQE